MSTPIGFDISKWQDYADLNKPSGVNLDLAVEKCDFGIIRAGYAGTAGTANIDERVEEYMPKMMDAIAKKGGFFPFTFYWYFLPDVSIMDQVRKFTEVVNKWSGLVNMPLVVDFEDNREKSATTCSQKLIDFKEEVENNCDHLVQIMYSRASVFDPSTVSGLQDYFPDLWAARYKNGLISPWSDGYYEFRDYDDWKFWQYTSSGSGAEYGMCSASIDLNYFNGTLEELHKYAKKEEDPEPTPRGKYVVESIPFQVKDETAELYLISDRPFAFYHWELSGPRGEIKYANLYFRAGGGEIRLDRRYVLGYDKVTRPAPTGLDVVEPGSHFRFEFEPHPDGELTEHTLKALVYYW